MCPVTPASTSISIQWLRTQKQHELSDVDDNYQSFHVMREGYTHLSDIEWSVVDRMFSNFVSHIISALLDSLNRDDQHATIVKSF